MFENVIVDVFCVSGFSFGVPFYFFLLSVAVWDVKSLLARVENTTLLSYSPPHPLPRTAALTHNRSQHFMISDPLPFL